jgi:hypothetical protein
MQSLHQSHYREASRLLESSQMRHHFPARCERLYRNVVRFPVC